MLGVGILNLSHFGELHCDKSSHLFLLSRSQVGKPISAASTDYLWVYFCERECVAPVIQDLFLYSGSDLGGEGLLSHAYKGLVLALA